MFTLIIVTFYPEIQHLISMCRELHNVGMNLLIFDNTPNTSSSIKLKEIFKDSIEYRINVYGEGINFGLATAYNKAIDLSLKVEGSIEGFIFFDQDSSVKSCDVAGLILEYYSLKEASIKVGVLGAKPVNNVDNPYHVREIFNNNLLTKKFTEVEFVISSFSLVPLSTFYKIGYFDDKLFIDLVDCEYSYRCSKNGLLNLVSKQIEFKHVIGDGRGCFFKFREFAISSPIRNYYQSRNIILVGRDYKKYGFIIFRLFKRCVQILLSGYFMGSSFLRFKYFFKGVVDGLRYIGGPI